MFNLGSLGELLIIVVAILVLFGPAKLPELLYDLGRLKQKLRLIIKRLSVDFDQYLSKGELDEYHKQVNDKYIKPPSQDNID